MLKHRDTISVTYFAQFLSEIAHTISNIRKYVHQIIHITPLKTKAKAVKQSIASVITSANNTFGELKEVQSLIAGYAKAHRLKLQKRSVSESNSTTYQSQHSKKSSFVREWYKNSSFQQQMGQRAGNRSRGRSGRSNNLDLSKQKKVGKDCIIEEQPIPQQGESNKQRTHVHITETSPKWQQRVQSLWSSIVQANRSSLQKIISKNEQCRSEVRLLRSQLIGSC